jgi:hypothetical protein
MRVCPTRPDGTNHMAGTHQPSAGYEAPTNADTWSTPKVPMCGMTWGWGRVSALTLHPPTNWTCDISTCTKHLQILLSIFVTISYCDTLTLWHFLLWHSDPKWMDCLSNKKMDFCHSVTFQSTVILYWPTQGCDILSNSDFDFCFFFFKETFPWDFWHLRDCSTKFSDTCRTVAWDVRQLKGL